LAESKLSMPLTVKLGDWSFAFGIWKWPTKVPRIALTLLVESIRYSK
jgi:hypothetical protein